MTNYELIQSFLDMLKEYAISNPNQEISQKFVYSNLMGFNVKQEHMPYCKIDEHFTGWESRYMYDNRINTFKIPKRAFLWFTNGKIYGNEIKLYIPLDYNHIKEGANQLFDFIASTGIEHESKISDKIRNDDLVVRVNNLKDAETIIDYINSNQYIKEGLMKTNPFLPNWNGVGITMDNNYSYNSTVSELISNFIETLKRYNRLDLLTVEELNKFVISSVPSIEDPDLKDIYSLISKTTTQEFNLNEFISHANNKLVDKYTSKRQRIVDPAYYLEFAISQTEKYYPGNSATAIKEYLKLNPMYFTNKERAREGLLKYVRPGLLINLMRTKLIENNVSVPSTDEELINEYLNLIINKQNNYQEQYNIIKTAFANTASVYNINQAIGAIKDLYFNNGVQCFTNRFNDRTNLKEKVINHDARKIILSNIDISGLDLNDTNEVLSRIVNAMLTVYNKIK